ncbi:Na+-transporting methylmalonyl-CoA/oxaloacetate decarboxylase subunit beta [Geosporobacter ferrireducens]|uniref:Na+-transporting methylmalonyl-CoA/oxaloacetate decarboxylase subunit beta n=1 Tax=Geosporobacter ferrireducens TaxID=1424294 RepID=A0A1D8GPM2_9FIRM|nr:Na+-transporting methylmalonyl-CoA/oxaloacetate decarboxylase subunit beta [Geosporobacter ferrireducens]AOT72900.1 Na+-transporting methylmalonyl-CoA/oxaloacetate decarboxylase subunit beta [Geosporobacter ferrireducens]MTI55305.1 sodium ion-translocating decarboxylase subunit beta [Geosporobacter ferrireducens]
MKIYYNASLWAKEKGLCGVPQRVNWQFKYAGTRHCIPVIYRFSKGIVFDVITFLDEVKLREFFEKYEAIGETLTPLQQRCAEQEHPYRAMSIKEIWINGKRTEGGYSSSSAVSIPWARQDDRLALVQNAYSSILKDTACFACQRFCVPYSETDSKMQKLLRFFRLNRINSVKLSTCPVQWFSPLDIHFEMSGKGERKEVCFVHPKTGVTHTLYFQNAELVEMSMDRDGKHSLYTMQAMYEIEPALPQGDSLQFNSSIQYTASSEDRFSLTEASSIGIIGGACGATAIFATAKNKEATVPQGLHGLPLYSCFSVPGFHKKETLHFILEGINIKDCDSKEYSFQ